MVEIFELTIGKIFLFIETLLRIIIPSGVSLAKIFIFLFSIILSSFLIIVWIKLELKNKDEISFWQLIFKSKRDYKFIKKMKNNFTKIKNTFTQDKIKGLIAIDDFLKQIIEMFDYPGENLEKKIDQLPQEIIKTTTEIKKAIKIVGLIKEKKQRGEELSLKENEYDLIFDVYQKFLVDLRVVPNENLLVMNQLQPEEQ